MKVFNFDLLLAVNFLCCLGLEGEKFGDLKRSNEDEWLDPGDIFEYDREKRVIYYFPLLPSFFKTICDELTSRLNIDFILFYHWLKIRVFVFNYTFMLILLPLLMTNMDSKVAKCPPTAPQRGQNRNPKS